MTQCSCFSSPSKSEFFSSVHVLRAETFYPSKKVATTPLDPISGDEEFNLEEDGDTPNEPLPDPSHSDHSPVPTRSQRGDSKKAADIERFFKLVPPTIDKLGNKLSAAQKKLQKRVCKPCS